MGPAVEFEKSSVIRIISKELRMKEEKIRRKECFNFSRGVKMVGKRRWGKFRRTVRILFVEKCEVAGFSYFRGSILGV